MSFGYNSETMSNQGSARQYAMSSVYNTKSLLNTGSARQYAMAADFRFDIVSELDILCWVPPKVPQSIMKVKKMFLEINLICSELG